MASEIEYKLGVYETSPAPTQTGGQLLINNDKTLADLAEDLQTQIDDINVSQYLPLTGGTLSGNLALGNNSITGVNSLSTTSLTLNGTNITTTLSTKMDKASNLSDLASPSTARTNLGLGTAAIVNTGTSGATIPLLNGTNTFSAINTITNNSITTTSTDGFIIANTTAATSGVQVQMSPRIRLRGTAWNGSASQNTDWILENRPTATGSGTVQSTLKLGVSLNGGAYSYPLTFSSSGGVITTTYEIQTSNNVTVNGAFAASNGVNITGGALYIPPDSGILFNGTSTISEDTSGTNNIVFSTPSGGIQFGDANLLNFTFKTTTTSTSSFTIASTFVCWTGTTGSATLPTVPTAGTPLFIKNRGSGTFTVNSNSGSQIYDTSLVASKAVTAGSNLTLISDGTYWNVM